MIIYAGPPVCPSVHSPVLLFICPSIHPSICLSFHPSIKLSVKYIMKKHMNQFSWTCQDRANFNLGVHTLNMYIAGWLVHLDVLAMGCAIFVAFHMLQCIQPPVSQPQVIAALACDPGFHSHNCQANCLSVLGIYMYLSVPEHTWNKTCSSYI